MIGADEVEYTRFSRSELYVLLLTWSEIHVDVVGRYRKGVALIFANGFGVEEVNDYFVPLVDFDGFCGEDIMWNTCLCFIEIYDGGDEIEFPSMRRRVITGPCGGWCDKEESY